MLRMKPVRSFGQFQEVVIIGRLCELSLELIKKNNKTNEIIGFVIGNQQKTSETNEIIGFVNGNQQKTNKTHEIICFMIRNQQKTQ